MQAQLQKLYFIYTAIFENSQNILLQKKKNQSKTDYLIHSEKNKKRISTLLGSN